MKKDEEVILELGDSFKSAIDNVDNPLDGINVYVRNNSVKKVKVTTKTNSITITVEKNKK